MKSEKRRENHHVVPGGVLLGIRGEIVPPGSSNPDPISDQNMPFSIPVFQTWPLKSIPIFRPDI